MGTSNSKPSGHVGTPQEYLRLIKECMERVQKKTLIPTHSNSPKFNFQQCKYLVEKLGLAIEAAELFLAQLNEKLFDFPSTKDAAKCLQSFKLLYVFSVEVESFTLDCCKDAWIQAALTLANVSEFISSMGFNLELWRIVFGARESFILSAVEHVYYKEVQIVMEKALSDSTSLKISLRRVLCSSKYKSLDQELAAFILDRLDNRLISVLGDDLTKSSQLSLFKAILNMKRKDLKLLGRGSSASVFNWTWLGIELAVKIFHGDDNPHFMKEVSIMKGLFHPNIISVLCFAKSNGKCFIAMEKMDGDLESLIQARLDNCGINESPFCLSEAIDIILQIGAGMHYLHESRIVHRDLKSMNILVRYVKATSDSKIEYVVAKVADFGVSKTKLNSRTNSYQTPNVGTTRWMAPELIEIEEAKQHKSTTIEVEGEDVKFPFKCDIYSFAMVCYEILTGNYPFSKINSPAEIKRMVLMGERPKLPDGCPIELKDLIKRCWSTNAENRPSFYDICKELRQLKCSLLTPCVTSANTSIGTSSMTTMEDSNIDHLQQVISSDGSQSSQTSPKWSFFRSFSSHKLKATIPFLDFGSCLIGPVHYPITLIQDDSKSSPQGSKIYGTSSFKPFGYFVNQVWPPIDPLDHIWPNNSKLDALKMDVIFFEGNVAEKEHMSCKETWVQRGKPNVGWPQDWLPKDLGGDVRVLLLEYNISEYGINYVLEKLLSIMVFSSSWNREHTWGRPIVLVGHSLGCIIIEQLVVALEKRAQSINILPKDELIDNTKAKVAHAFLTNLQGCFFYAPPWTGLVQNEYILKGVFGGLSYSPELFSNLIYETSNASMLKLLSQDFMRAEISKHIKLMAITEGYHTRGINTVVPRESMQDFPGAVVKLEDSNHADVCKPVHKEHLAYTKLVNFVASILKN